VSARKTKTPRLYGLTGLQAWLAERGVVISRQALQRRARLGQLGQLVDERYIVTEAEAEALLAEMQRDEA